MRKSEVAVEIAKDVLAQLRAQKLIAQEGTYCTIEYEDGREFMEQEESESLKSVLATQDLKCRVCALGGMFIGYVRKFNKVDAYANYHSDEIIPKLKKYFSEHDLDLIEFAFEGKDIRFTSSLSEDEESRAYEFYKKYWSDDERLRAIMLNIIRNKGKFILPRWTARVAAAQRW